jgi:hypothetical protein
MASRVSPTLTWIGNYVFIYSLRMARIGVLLALQVKKPDCAEHELSSPGRSSPIVLRYQATQF